MPRKTKAAKVILTLQAGRRREVANTDPVIDGDERALISYLRRIGVKSTTHSIPALARLVVSFLRHRKRH